MRVEKSRAKIKKNEKILPLRHQDTKRKLATDYSDFTARISHREHRGLREFNNIWPQISQITEKN